MRYWRVWIGLLTLGFLGVGGCMAGRYWGERPECVCAGFCFAGAGFLLLILLLIKEQCPTKKHKNSGAA